MGKGFDDIQYPFVTEILIKGGKEGEFFSLLKDICEKSIANIILVMKHLTFSP